MTLDLKKVITMGGKGGSPSSLHKVVQSVIHKVTPSLGKAVEHRKIGVTTDGSYSDKDFNEDLTKILEPALIDGYECIELK